MDLRRFRIDLCGILWTCQSLWTDRVSYGLIKILEELSRSFNHLSIFSWTREIPHRLANTLMGSPYCVMDLSWFVRDFEVSCGPSQFLMDLAGFIWTGPNA